MAQRDEVVAAHVRRSPRYSRFLVLGVVLGLLVAMILTLAFNGTTQAADNGAVYSPVQVFGFLALVCASVGLLAGGGVALLLDVVVGRRTREVKVDRETVQADD